MNLFFSRDTRLLLLAPHPDDESLACAVFLQRALQAGASVRVLYATDGDNNPWPQRALERKWRICARDRERWGRLRRIEARAALRELGMAPRQAHFLGLPDQGLKHLVRRKGKATKSLFRDAIVSWRPSLVLAPSVQDTHADHHALGLLTRDIHDELLETLPRLAVWSYKVHGRRASFSRGATLLTQTAAETQRKLAAIRRHKTQLALSGKRFLAYAVRPEQFREVKLMPSTSAVTSERKRPESPASEGLEKIATAT